MVNNIENFFNFLGVKIVNDVFVQNDFIVYFLVLYGVLKFNVKLVCFVFIIFIGVDVNIIVVNDGQMYMVIEEGVYKLNEDVNFLEDFMFWEL